MSSTTKKASRKCILAGVIPEIRPNFPTAAARLAYERPISLLSPLANLLEKLVLPTRTLTKHLISPQHQHFFRKGQSTTIALHIIHSYCSNGLNQRESLIREPFHLAIVLDPFHHLGITVTKSPKWTPSLLTFHAHAKSINKEESLRRGQVNSAHFEN